MLEQFFKNKLPLMPLPLRVTLGLIFITQGYMQITGNDFCGDIFFLSFIYLFCGLAILVGFFTRLASISMLVSLIVFWYIATLLGADTAPHMSIETQVLILTATLTLVFSGSGKFSLEKYFKIR